MPLSTLADAFYDELCDIYHAEKQLVKALPKMAKKASDKKLAEAITEHLEQTKQHVQRVEAAFNDTGKAAKAKKCDAMAGLIEEAKEMMEEDAEPDVMDAVLIGLAQKVEHYEIATYGTSIDRSLPYFTQISERRRPALGWSQSWLPRSNHVVQIGHDRHANCRDHEADQLDWVDDALLVGNP
ncbi:MAG: DUF892 family protein [Planctomycetia bacterium]|nr:DUF892 family protein [Planctomycetia bacterium]